MSSMETYRGRIQSPADAIILFESCRLGLLPRVCRRLSERERRNIQSGSVFVWDEREAGMRRWTDGKSWSASRVAGSFLTYREMEGKRGGSTGVSSRTPDGTKGSDDDRDSPDGYRYKPDGLMKQSFSITTSTGQHLHLISYFSRVQDSNSGMPHPSSDPNLRSVKPSSEMYPESTIHDTQGPPAMLRTPTAGAVPPPHGQMPGYQNRSNFLAHAPPYYQQASHNNPYPGGFNAHSHPQGFGRPPISINTYGHPANGHQPGYHRQSRHQSHPYPPQRYSPLPSLQPPGLSGPAGQPPKCLSPGPSPVMPHQRPPSSSNVSKQPNDQGYQGYYPSPAKSHSYTSLMPQESPSSRYPSQATSPASAPAALNADARVLTPQQLSQTTQNQNLHPDFRARARTPSPSPGLRSPYGAARNEAPSPVQTKFAGLGPVAGVPDRSAGGSSNGSGSSTIPGFGTLMSGASAYDRDHERRSRSSSRSPGDHSAPPNGSTPGAKAEPSPNGGSPTGPGGAGGVMNTGAGLDGRGGGPQDIPPHKLGLTIGPAAGLGQDRAMLNKLAGGGVFLR